MLQYSHPEQLTTVQCRLQQDWYGTPVLTVCACFGHILPSPCLMKVEVPIDKAQAQPLHVVCTNHQQRTFATLARVCNSFQSIGSSSKGSP